MRVFLGNIFGQVQRVMFDGVNFLVMFKFFGHIHLVILNRSSDYSSFLLKENIFTKSHIVSLCTTEQILHQFIIGLYGQKFGPLSFYLLGPLDLVLGPCHEKFTCDETFLYVIYPKIVKIGSVARKFEQKVKFQKTPKDLHQSTCENPKYIHQSSFKRQKYLHQSKQRQSQNQFFAKFSKVAKKVDKKAKQPK